MEFDRIIDSFIARFIGTKHERDVKQYLALSRRVSTPSNRK